eukprot:2295552-Alexandrium_andersonii.AAC.1
MSASLVGSEMCIRDRSSLSYSRKKVRKSFLSSINAAGMRGSSPQIGPVSYTHLTLPTICSV